MTDILIEFPEFFSSRLVKQLPCLQNSQRFLPKILSLLHLLKSFPIFFHFQKFSIFVCSTLQRRNYMTWWSGPLLHMACMSPLGSIGFYVNFHRDVSCGQWNTSFSMLFSNLKTGEFAYAIWIEKVPNASLSYRRSSSDENRRAFLPPWNWYLVDFSPISYLICLWESFLYFEKKFKCQKCKFW